MYAKYPARKLIRFHQTGGPNVLTIDEVPLPEPGENEVVVRVRAMGLSRIDVLWREGGYVEDPGFSSSNWL
jgi:NADPH:quinone reductase-like Zn-dependent oxidoreductase